MVQYLFLFNSKICILYQVPVPFLFWGCIQCQSAHTFGFEIKMTALNNVLQSNLLTHLHSRVAKTGLTILVIFYLQSHVLRKNYKKNINQKPHNNSRSNILRTLLNSQVMIKSMREVSMVKLFFCKQLTYKNGTK